jgi:hypothetical protein
MQLPIICGLMKLDCVITPQTARFYALLNGEKAMDVFQRVAT